MKGMSPVMLFIAVVVVVVVLVVSLSLLGSAKGTGETLTDRIINCFNNLIKCATGQQQKIPEGEAVK